MITILMPIYNGIEFIDESVSSIIKQTYLDWELIMGINGHPENSEVYKIAKKYEEKDKRIKVYDLPQNIKGKSESLNKMLAYSNFNWISLLDVDDKWLNTKLSSQISYMNEFDVIGTRCKYFGDSDVIPYIPVGNITKFNFLLVNPVINSSCLLKKELCYWNGDLNLEDYDLWLRLRKDNKKFFNVPDIQVLHRIHQESAFNAKGNNLYVNKLKEKYL